MMIEPINRFDVVWFAARGLEYQPTAWRSNRDAVPDPDDEKSAKNQDPFFQHGIFP